MYSQCSRDNNNLSAQVNAILLLLIMIMIMLIMMLTLWWYWVEELVPVTVAVRPSIHKGITIFFFLINFFDINSAISRVEYVQGERRESIRQRHDIVKFRDNRTKYEIIPKKQRSCLTVSTEWRCTFCGNQYETVHRIAIDRRAVIWGQRGQRGQFGTVSLSGYIPRSLEVAATLLSPEREIPAAVTELTEAGRCR